MAVVTNGYISIYSNDGVTQLAYFSLSAADTNTLTVTDTGAELNGETYTYSGDKTFLGLATSANATETTYSIGDTFTAPAYTSTVDLYIVEGEAETTPTAESVKTKLQSLITASNAKTGKSDANLTDAVNTLLEGYGQGGGGIIEVDELPEVGEKGVIYKYQGKLYEYSYSFYDVIFALNGGTMSFRSMFEGEGIPEGIPVSFIAIPTRAIEGFAPLENTFYLIEDENDIFALVEGELISAGSMLNTTYNGIISDISEANTEGSYHYALFKNEWKVYSLVNGTLSIIENGEYDVTSCEKANVNVPNNVVVGKRRFSSYPDFPATAAEYISQNVNFTTIYEGKVVKCTAMGAGPAGSMAEDKINYDTEDGNRLYVFSIGWQEEGARMVDFGDTPQFVSKEFADFIENGTQKEYEHLFEVSTEAEMNALLETAEVGSIYKYTGETTDTYENGAWYVVEEDVATDATVTITNTSGAYDIYVNYVSGERITTIGFNETKTITVPIGSVIYCVSISGIIPSWTNTSTTGDIVYGYDLGYMTGEYTINGDGTIVGYGYDAD